MPRRREQTSTTPTVGSVLSILLCIGIGVGVVILRAQRRAARNQDTFQVEDNRGGGNTLPGPPGAFHLDTPAPPQGNSGFQPGPSFPPEQPPAAPDLKPGVREAQPVGGFFAKNDYREYREDGALLTGFEVGDGKVNQTTIIAYLRPIWLTAQGEVYGTAYGRSQSTTVVVKARQGYAVGGIFIAGGGALEGFVLTFMRIGDRHLDPNDAYTSDWYGEPSRKPDPNAMKTGDGSFVIGFHGKRFEDKGGKNFDNAGGICTIGFYLWVKE